jgi:outer membrane protein OmpA-like peptidoglycan-associated protein
MNTARPVLWIVLLATLVATSGVTQEVTDDPDISRELRFNIEDEAEYRLVSINEQTISLNGYAIRDAEIVTRVQIEPRGHADGQGRYIAVFSLTESSRVAGQPVGLESQHRSEYLRDGRGFMDIDDRYIMPVSRNIPIFPEEPVSPGDTWTAEAQEVHDLSRGYNVSEPLRLTFPVSYEYAGVTTWNGVEVDLIRAEYNIAHREQRDAMLYPESITGQSLQRLYWDNRRGRLVGSEEEYWIEFRLSDGRTITYQGDAVVEVEAATPLDRQSVVAALQARLDEAGIENTRVSDQEEGVVLILERIGFPPDSARILPDEEQRLTIIGEILSDFPENDLLITGHTALAGTAAGREQLSVSRARAVGEFFLANDVREPSRILYRGVGAAEPIADNDTAQGRSRNRRVEIMVLDN